MERFNVEVWAKLLRVAIAERNGEWMAQLMSENDRNGCFSFDDYCREFGETTREEWIDGSIECAEGMLADIE